MVAQSMEPVAPLLTPPRRRDPTPYSGRRVGFDLFGACTRC